MTAALSLLLLAQPFLLSPTPAKTQLELPVGVTAELRSTHKLKRAADGPLTAVVKGVRGEGAVTLLPGAAVSSKGRQLSLLMAVRARRPAEAAKVSAKIEVTDKRGVLTKFEWQSEISAVEQPLKPDTFAAVAEGYRAAQALAEKEHRKLGDLRSYVRLDRFDPPPPRDRIKEQFETLVAFRQHRLRAYAARHYLLAAAKKGETTEAAVRTLGTLERGPSDTQSQARAIDELDSRQAVALARRSLDNLEFGKAEGFLNKLRIRGTLSRAQLSEVLGYLSILSEARGREEKAKRLAGQSRCLAPKTETKLKHPGLLALAKKVAVPEEACAQSVAIKSLVAKRIEGADGPELEVLIEFGPDPFGLVSAARVELYGYGGGMFKSVRGAAPEAGQGNLIRVTMSEPKDAANHANRVLMKAALLEVSGIELALLGDPDPTSVELRGESKPSKPIPWWVWAVAGGAALIGGGVALGVYASNRDPFPQRGIGPVGVEF